MPGNERIEAQHHADNQRRLAAVEAAQASTNEAVEKLSRDVHTLKGSMADNNALTQETLTGVDAIKAQLAQLAQLDVPSLKEIADAVNSMRGGVRVLGWLERPAKWLAAIVGAAVALYGLWKIK